MVDNEELKIVNGDEPENNNNEPKKEDVGEVLVSVDAQITKETYLEFVSFQNNPLKTLKQSLFMCLFVCLFVYLLQKNTDEPTKVLSTMGIYCLIIIVFSLGMTMFSRFVTAPKQYDKNGFASIEIKVDFTTLGLLQTVEVEGNKQSALIHWENIGKCVETDNSYFFITQRKACILSKVDFSEEDIKKITELIIEKLGPVRYSYKK